METLGKIEITITTKNKHKHLLGKIGKVHTIVKIIQTARAETKESKKTKGEKETEKGRKENIPHLSLNQILVSPVLGLLPALDFYLNSCSTVYHFLVYDIYEFKFIHQLSVRCLNEITFPHKLFG